MSRKKLDELIAIEEKVQQHWEKEKIFEEDAPAKSKIEQPKYLVTFPYPYMNGKLHLGHAFTLSKCEVGIPTAYLIARYLFKIGTIFFQCLIKLARFTYLGSNGL